MRRSIDPRLIRQKELGSDNPATQLVRKRLEELLTNGTKNGW